MDTYAIIVPFSFAPSKLKISKKTCHNIEATLSICEFSVLPVLTSEYSLIMKINLIMMCFVFEKCGGMLM